MSGKLIRGSVVCANGVLNHWGVTFEMILVADLSNVDDRFWTIHEERFKEYRKRGIESHFDRYILDSKSPVGFDLLIVDDQHLGIAFSRLPRPKQTKELGIRFWEQRHITELVVDWFDWCESPTPVRCRPRAVA